MPKVPEHELLPTYIKHIAGNERISSEQDARALLLGARGGSDEAGQRFVEGNLWRVVDILPEGVTGREALDQIEAENHIVMEVLQDYDGATPLQEIDQRILSRRSR